VCDNLKLYLRKIIQKITSYLSRIVNNDSKVKTYLRLLVERGNIYSVKYSEMCMKRQLISSTKIINMKRELKQ